MTLRTRLAAWYCSLPVAAVARVARHVDEEAGQLLRRSATPSANQPTVSPSGSSRWMQPMSKSGVLVLGPAVDRRTAAARHAPVRAQVGVGPAPRRPGMTSIDVGPAAEEVRAEHAVPGGQHGLRADEPAGADRARAARPAHPQRADHPPRRQVGVDDPHALVDADHGLERRRRLARGPSRAGAAPSATPRRSACPAPPGVVAGAGGATSAISKAALGLFTDLSSIIGVSPGRGRSGPAHPNRVRDLLSRPRRARMGEGCAASRQWVPSSPGTASRRWRGAEAWAWCSARPTSRSSGRSR